MSRWLALIALGLVACAENIEDDHEICLNQPPGWLPPGADQEVMVPLNADAPMEIFVTEMVGCTKILEVACSVEQDGDLLQVTTSSTLKGRPGFLNCESALNFHTESCQTDVLSAGTYTIAYGDNELDVDIPSEDALICMRAR